MGKKWGWKKKTTTFAAVIQNHRNMEEKKTPIHSHQAESIRVSMYTREEEVEKRLLRGRVLLDTDEKTLLFAQNEPRGPRSKEIFRGDHSRLVRRPDGNYTMSFCAVDIGEINLREAMIAEVRKGVDAMKRDKENLKKMMKKQEKEERKDE